MTSRRIPMMKSSIGGTMFILGFATSFNISAHAAETLDTTPRSAVISAFQPEWAALHTALTERRSYVINGTTFETGVLEDKPVVLFQSGISMVNAAMTSQ